MNDFDLSKLETWLSVTYPFKEPVQVELLRSHTNDVYLVKTASQQYILKVYGIKWRTESEIRYEVALIEHLAKKGLRVANTIAGKDGQNIYQVATPKGEQYALLFEFAAGKKPQPPFSNELYVAFGRAIAQMHEFSDDFVTEYERSPLDSEHIIARPIRLVIPLIKNWEEQLALLRIAAKVRDKLKTRKMLKLDWGPIHGDATLDNLHLTDDGQIVLYDFDSGGSGWRAADMQGWAHKNAEYAEKWEAFKQGYSSVRELKALDLEAARYLSAAWLIWGLQIDLEQRVLEQGDAKVAEYLTMQLGAIKAQAELAFG